MFSLFGIFDQEFMVKAATVWDQFLELRKENPEVAMTLVWVAGMVMWGLVSYYRKSGQAVAWGDFGRMIQQALQSSTGWKWSSKLDADTSIYYDLNGKRLSCLDGGDFLLDGKSIKAHLAKKELKELAILRAKIVKDLEENDRVEKAAKDERDRVALLDALNKATAKPVLKSSVLDLSGHDYVPTPRPIPSILPKEATKVTHEVKPEYPPVSVGWDGVHVSASNPVIEKGKAEVAKPVDVLEGLNLLLLTNALAQDSSQWRWGTKNNVPTGNSVVTEFKGKLIVCNFRDETYTVDGVAVSNVPLELQDLRDSIVSDLEDEDNEAEDAAREKTEENLGVMEENLETPDGWRWGMKNKVPTGNSIVKKVDDDTLVCNFRDGTYSVNGEELDQRFFEVEDFDAMRDEIVQNLMIAGTKKEEKKVVEAPKVVPPAPVPVFKAVEVPLEKVAAPAPVVAPAPKPVEVKKLDLIPVVLHSALQTNGGWRFGKKDGVPTGNSIVKKVGDKALVCNFQNGKYTVDGTSLNLSIADTQICNLLRDKIVASLKANA